MWVLSTTTHWRIRPDGRAGCIPPGRCAQAPEIANAALFLVDGGITAAYVTPE